VDALPGQDVLGHGPVDPASLQAHERMSCFRLAKPAKC
jgi:hypothetical protein